MAKMDRIWQYHQKKLNLHQNDFWQLNIRHALFLWKRPVNMDFGEKELDAFHRQEKYLFYCYGSINHKNIFLAI